MINRLLIANRGETACRIIRSAQRLGIHTIAVYSTADLGALHCEMADEAHCIGDAPATASYLNIAALLAAAQKTRADAVHPGCGFLSESPAFAQSVVDAGLIFVGPSPTVMAQAASKATARQLAAQAGIAVLPGFEDADANDDTLHQAAKSIGFPILIKATAGGGGRGMRVVNRAADFAAALEQARREAKSGFDSDAVILEKYIPRARHVEVQLLADQQGNRWLLGERDCTLQRRRQKVVEESPAPNLSAKTRQTLHDYANQIAATLNYENAGTVEFLLNAADNALYFLEINARLQIEHPLTEMLFALDLVEWQLRIAAGESLPDQMPTARGWAMEARVCAENPNNDFLPASGRIIACHWPPSTAVRTDAGVRAGDTVSTHYDSMVAKIIAHGDGREAARQKLLRALAMAKLDGVANNIACVRDMLVDDDFIRGTQWTTLIEDKSEKLLSALQQRQERLAAAAVAWLFFASYDFPAAGFRLNQAAQIRVLWQDDDRGDIWELAATMQDKTCQVTNLLSGACLTVTEISGTTTGLAAIINGVRTAAQCTRTDDGALKIFAEGLVLTMRTAALAAGAEEESDGVLRAPMSAIVREVKAAQGHRIKKGDTLLVLEAMKMEIIIAAPRDGVIAAVHCAPGDTVEQGMPLAQLDDED